MSVPIEDKKIYKNQHKDYEINVADALGQTNITGFTVAFYVKQTVSGDPVIEKTTDEITEIKITNGSKGIAELYLVPADTLSLDVGKYHYEVWITDLNSKDRPILMGYFWVMSVSPTFVNLIRKLLDEAGEMRVQTISDELVYPSTPSSVYVSRPRINSVIGVYLFADDAHRGTNSYPGGGCDESTCRISAPARTADCIKRVI